MKRIFFHTLHKFGKACLLNNLNQDTMPIKISSFAKLLVRKQSTLKDTADVIQYAIWYTTNYNISSKNSTKCNNSIKNISYSNKITEKLETKDMLAGQMNTGTFKMLVASHTISTNMRFVSLAVTPTTLATLLIL